MMTFTGSMVAVLKLHGTIASKPRVIPFRWFSTILMFVAMIVFGTFAFTGGQDWNDRTLGITFIALVAFFASVYGVSAVMAIGGGDMPVSISFLNSLSGFSTSASGFMLSNKALVVAGAFVGCSGIILTLVMCNAMNRKVSNVLIGGFGDGVGVSAKQTAKKEGTVKQIQADEVAELLTSSRSVIIVPGYGMVSQSSRNRRNLVPISTVLISFYPFRYTHRQLQRRSTRSRSSRHVFENEESRCVSPFTLSPVVCRVT